MLCVLHRIMCLFDTETFAVVGLEGEVRALERGLLSIEIENQYIIVNYSCYFHNFHLSF